MGLTVFSYLAGVIFQEIPPTLEEVRMAGLICGWVGLGICLLANGSVKSLKLITKIGNKSLDWWVRKFWTSSARAARIGAVEAIHPDSPPVGDEN
ncbi:hypothetical protein [Streptomyces beigongshangae]|uniref:hypothetical protein n=1 Tax=Streptomyces beigongshangae TaxID=2841597 RepID=UPI001C855135|nr:hypothetical protein [Streptomyces sp. REN17]